MFQYPLSDRSWWDMAPRPYMTPAAERFSILYRIDLGGTCWRWVSTRSSTGFSILYRIDLGGTRAQSLHTLIPNSFSILYRIDLGGTSAIPAAAAAIKTVSVSSIGSILVGPPAL